MTLTGPDYGDLHSKVRRMAGNPEQKMKIGGR
jgi:hypothetical protein